MKTFIRATPALAASVLALAAGLQPAPALAQEAMIGEIKCFGGNFAPRGWALLDGQLLSIASNSALFSILGTTYGGDGRTTFALPDMRGRVLVHAGNGTGTGLSPRRLGERGGSETNTLNTMQMPSHAHPHTHEVAPLGASTDATSNDPTGKVPATKSRTTLYADPVTTSGASNLVEQAATETRQGSANVGGGQPVNNLQPYVTVNCMIATVGVYPSRN